MKSKTKIKKLYKSKFDTELSDEELELLIKHKCKCDECETSIFELDDFPEIVEEHDLVMCEVCYAESGHRVDCQICACSFDTLQQKEWYWYENKEDAEPDGKPGIYKINWFDSFAHPLVECFEPALANIDIGIFGGHYKDTWSGWICPDCAANYSKKDNCFTVTNPYDLLFEEYRNIHSINERINARGVFEQAHKAARK